MSLYEPTTMAGTALPVFADCLKAVDLIAELAALMRDIETNGEIDQFPLASLQQLFTAGVSMVATKFDSGEDCLPLPENAEVSATAVMITATGLLKSANLELFELGMWQSWSGTR